jgi:hypothetical protein
MNVLTNPELSLRLPTAQTFFAEIAAIARRLAWLALGIETILQAVPFQCRKYA